MKLRYYMRGLGIGIIVTAIIMGISLGGKKESLTDAEIRDRALKLGMIESTVLTDTVAEPEVEAKPEGQTEKETVADEEKEAEPTSEETKSVEDDKNPLESIDTTDDPIVEETPEAESLPEQEESLVKDNQLGDAIQIEVKSGDSSVSVSKRIADAGLVVDANEFDRFLCQNGYDKSICVGSYSIPEGSTEEEIAKIITKR